MFFQPPERVTASGEAPPEPPQPPQDPGVAVALAQIEIAKQAAAADAEIKPLKAQSDIEIAQWKTRPSRAASS